MEVDLDHALPHLGVEVRRAAERADARVVEHDVETAEPLGAGVDEGLDLGAVGHVEPAREDGPPARVELLGEGGERLGLEIAQHEPRALGVEPAGGRRADPRRRARHQRHLPVESSARSLRHPGLPVCAPVGTTPAARRCQLRRRGCPPSGREVQYGRP